ncbi:MAG: UDP-4-amino-4,6-dideoxy-N-acetyl-beta-L-altrosamine transaminase [Terriglobales bacterium]
MPKVLPYGRHWLDDDDIQAVIEVLRSDWLTTGPKVEAFEQALAQTAGTAHAVAVSSGTAALHAAMYAIGVGPGDEVIVPAITFAATANAVVFQQATPVFADVDAGTLLLNPASAAAKITTRTKAIVAVDYAGQPCDYDGLREIANRHHLWLVADGCHSLGAKYRGRSSGSLADLTTFSFHPVKHITTGEGGAVTTDDPELAQRMRIFRNHGITTDHRQRDGNGTWYYEMVVLGYNYRISDFQCALGTSQLRKLPQWLRRRRELAGRYGREFARVAGISPLCVSPEVEHAYHLYVVRIDSDRFGCDRNLLFRKLREQGIGVNVHYIPVHLHPYYRQRFGLGAGMCPVAEAAYSQILSLPLFPQIRDEDVEKVVIAIAAAGRTAGPSRAKAHSG